MGKHHSEDYSNRKRKDFDFDREEKRHDKSEKNDRTKGRKNELARMLREELDW